MSKQAFFDSNLLKRKLISKLASTRIIKNIEIEAGRIFTDKEYLKGTSLSTEPLEKTIDEVVNTYKNEYNIPTSFSILIESIYQGLDNKTHTSFTFPEKIYLSIKPKQNLHNIWCDFGIWLLSDKKIGLRRMAESIELLEIVEDAEAIYKKYKKIPHEDLYNNKIDFEELSHDFLSICKRIEDKPITETSMMLYALMQALVDDSYIYDALYGIYKPNKIKKNHYSYYSKKVLELISEEKIA